VGSRDTLAVTAANRLGWNKIAARRNAEPAAFFLAGNTTLDEVEIQFLPDVRSKSLLHLACANGNDSLSWAARGASVTGIDISDVAIRIAQATAEATGMDARFRVADVYNLPADLGRFDIVYMSWGGICWMPDLQRWAETGRDLLRPGGIFALFEHHPLWEILSVHDGKLSVVGDYFSRQPRDIEHTDAAKRPTGCGGDGDADLTSFVWPVSDVLTALTGAGLSIDRFTEGSLAAMYEGLGSQAAFLPAYYAVLASKPDNESAVPLAQW